MHEILTPFENVAASQPGWPAACDQSLSLDYRTFQALACGLAGQIVGRTGKPHVGVLLPTSVAGALSIFACWYAGRVPVPLNFLLTPPELARVIADADIDLVVTIDTFAKALSASQADALLMAGKTTLIPGSRAAPSATAEELATLIYTSGTSGDPKGVRLTFGNLMRNARACIEHVRLTPDQVFLSVLPQFHSFGFTAMTMLPLILGASVHYLPRFSPAAVVSTIAEKRVSVFMAVASMYAALAKIRSADPAMLQTLGLAVSGGEALPVAVGRAFAEKFGVEICEGYGLTETSPVATLNTPWSRKLGSVGLPLPGVQVFAADVNGKELPADTEGELVIRGHCVMQGYHNKPAATADVVRAGALFTGDIGRVDQEGFVHITGRAKEIIIIGGENVFPREIETAIAEHPAVAEVAVIGAKDELRGEVAVAFVLAQDGASVSEGELRAVCRERLAPFKVPRDIRIASELPRGPTGKILKRALRELI